MDEAINKLKSQALVLARKSKISELESVLRSGNIDWTECRHPSGDTPLHVASQTGRIPVVRYLLDFNDGVKNVDIPNLAGKTALHEACQNSQPDVVSLLLSKGANARALKQADWTPLMLACTKTGERALMCCQLLLRQAGPVLLHDRNKDGWNSLHMAVREGDISIVKELLHADTDFTQASTRSNNGRTPLHTAALHGHCTVVAHLLSLECLDCEAKDSCGSTPIHDAVRSGNIDTFKVLVKGGADLSVHNDEGYGVQHMAAQTGQVHMLQYIIEELTSKTEAKSNSKTTPLHCAVRAGQVTSVQILLKVGADPNVQDAWGRTSFDIVPEKNAPDVKRVLSQLFN